MDSLLDDPTWAEMHPLPCTDTPWPGVQCEIAVYIPSTLFGTFSILELLALRSNPTLFGEIPSSLAKVPTLRVLSLSQNNLYGKIPKEIGGMVSLEQLDLSYNKLSGSIPQEIGGLKSLTILDLSWNGLQDFSHNSLSGPVPETLSGLKKLEYLIIEDNPINSGLPLFIGTLKKLKVLSFSGCGLTGPLLPSLSHLDGLIALSLDNNNLSETISSDLGMLPNLDHLNLSHNFLTGEVSLPEAFINRLGKRLDLAGNVGLCTRQKFKKNSKISPSFFTDSYMFGNKKPCYIGSFK
ncbi:putative LRR receptor-like serine/threonine-protein kinase [Heracleum sosnowskyi]|uniref:LRR receptor-like serine/threonine-protein kinase n=1 Tax=Heracleum sosnowskyi TaxID=360622 RepID=A0AAD8HLH4_9APIA|nr:putative LRR receptor-like serine/threonine-protein kinase [Heracleum sosnowskyi]